MHLWQDQGVSQTRNDKTPTAHAISFRHTISASSWVLYRAVRGRATLLTPQRAAGQQGIGEEPGRAMRCAGPSSVYATYLIRRVG